MSYQPNIPTGSVPLNQDYLNIKGNFQQLDTVYTIDHVPYTDTSSELGYHTAIHLVPQSPPGSVAGFGQIFSETVGGGDQDLFWISGNGNIARLTGANFSSTGFAYMGGLLMNWGTSPISANPALTTISFTQPYTNASKVFSIIANRITSDNGTTGQEIRIVAGQVTATNFKISSSSSSSANSIYWMAVGTG
jgi:hypothetical protein